MLREVLRKIANARPLCRIASSDDEHGGSTVPTGFSGMESNVVFQYDSVAGTLLRVLGGR
jgi:hypothetical protein